MSKEWRVWTELEPCWRPTERRRLDLSSSDAFDWTGDEPKSIIRVYTQQQMVPWFFKEKKRPIYTFRRRLLQVDNILWKKREEGRPLFFLNYHKFTVRSFSDVMYRRDSRAIWWIFCSIFSSENDRVISLFISYIL